MAKGNRHIKRLKAEKAKIKLKKSTNITDTNFKVKQIILKKQLKDEENNEILSRRKLNLKDLLSRLHHHNTPSKEEAIKDLLQIINLHGRSFVLSNLSELIQGISHLGLDKEKSIRKGGGAVVKAVLEEITEQELSPHFTILLSYLNCFLTHLDSSIREDSLLFLDIFLLKTPSLVTQNTSKILPNLFDLISKLKSDKIDKMQNRTLNVTTIKWKVQVLERLQKILEGIVQTNKLEKTSTICQNQYSYSKTANFPIYENIEFDQISNIQTNFDTQVEEVTITNYVNVIVTLLFETWLEVVPNNKTQDVSLIQEASSVLNCLTKILLLLITYLENHPDDKLLIDFKKMHRNSFSKYILAQFPYTKIVRSKITYCNAENLNISILALIFGEKKSNILAELNEYLSSKPEIQPELLKLIQKVFSLKFPVEDLEKILQLVIDLYMENNNYQLFELLCRIGLNLKINRLKPYKHFLRDLSDLLLKQEISEETIDIFCKFSKMGLKTFNSVLATKFPQIIENLENLQISGKTSKDEILLIKYKIIGLVYFIPAEFLEKFQNSSFQSPNLEKYFREILQLRLEMF